MLRISAVFERAMFCTFFRAVIEIDSVNSGGSVQLESIESASQVQGAIDSSQESELVTTNHIYIYNQEYTSQELIYDMTDIYNDYIIIE